MFCGRDSVRVSGGEASNQTEEAAYYQLLSEDAEGSPLCIRGHPAVAYHERSRLGGSQILFRGVELCDTSCRV